MTCGTAGGTAGQIAEKRVTLVVAVHNLLWGVEELRVAAGFL